MLPSEAIARGNTFDMYVLDVATRWIKYQQEQADGKESITKKSSRMPTQSEMQAMVAAVKNKGSGNGNKS
jgi:Tfp pilus assembly protein PilO